jgi:HAD superfamily hydrolase (TIGR01509 family)
VGTRHGKAQFLTVDAIPLGQIDTLFLDAGNTLVSIDFPWVCRELAEHGIDCEPSVLQRAEAAARPGTSDAMASQASSEGLRPFERHLRGVLGALPEAVLAGRDAFDLARALAPVLRAGGQTQRLWSYVLDGVPEALAAFRRRDLKLVVVSNSDGTVEQGLVEQELRSFFDVVIDSHVVGFQKPDPRIFEHALARAAAEPRRTLHVGDMYFADIVGARRAGVHPLLLDPYGDWTAPDCAVLPDLTALEGAFAAVSGNL